MDILISLSLLNTKEMYLYPTSFSLFAMVGISNGKPFGCGGPITPCWSPVWICKHFNLWFITLCYWTNSQKLECFIRNYQNKRKLDAFLSENMCCQFAKACTAVVLSAYWQIIWKPIFPIFNIMDSLRCIPEYCLIITTLIVQLSPFPNCRHKFCNILK